MLAKRSLARVQRLLAKTVLDCLCGVLLRFFNHFPFCLVVVVIVVGWGGARITHMNSQVYSFVRLSHNRRHRRLREHP